jgi:hypothetical protein
MMYHDRIAVSGLLIGVGDSKIGLLGTCFLGRGFGHVILRIGPWFTTPTHIVNTYTSVTL